MAKESGLGSKLWINANEISADVSAMDNISLPLAVLPSTGIDKFAMERMAGQIDAALSYTAFWNPGLGGTHDIVKTLPTITTSDPHVLYMHNAGAIGRPGFGMVAKALNWDP